MPDAYYYNISALIDRPCLVAWNEKDANGVRFTHNTRGEPFVTILINWMYSTISGPVIMHIAHSRRTFRTKISGGKNIFDGLAIAADLVKHGKSSVKRRPIGNWTPRTRITQRGTSRDDGDYGVFGSRDHINLPSSWWYVENPWADLNFSTSSLNGEVFVTFDAIRDLAIRAISTVGTSADFETRDAVGRRNFAYISELDYGDDHISYTAHTKAWNLSGYRSGYACHYKVTIERGLGVSLGAMVTMNGIEQVYVLKSDQETSVKPTGRLPRYFIEGQQDDILRIKEPEFRKLTKASIRGAIPILYHLQSQAFAKGMDQLSRNVENVIESPELIPLLGDLANSFMQRRSDSTSRLVKKIPIISLYNKIRDVLGLLAGGYLAYNFAVRPGLETLQDLLTNVTDLKDELFESTWKSEGDNSAFSSLPAGLRRFIIDDICDESDVVRYRVVFHTQLQLNIDKHYMARLLTGIYGYAARYGLIPKPSVVWDLMPLSFVVDWFVPIGSLIQSHENFIQMRTSRLGTIGHSIFIELELKDGRILDLYLRSNNSDRPLDPASSQSWLPGSGIPTGTAVALAVVQAMRYIPRL